VMKAGLMEIADVFVVNKADRPGADRIRQELEVAMGFRAGQVYRHVGAHHGAHHGARPAPRSVAGSAAWEPPVLATVASSGTGIDELLGACDRHYAHATGSGALEERRRRRREARTREVVDRAVRRWIWTDGESGEVEAVLAEVRAGAKSPYDAAKAIVARLSGSVV